MSFEEIFHPSSGHAKDHMNAEKILPAPTPAAGDKPLLGEDDDIYIPQVAWGAGTIPDPPKWSKPKKASGAADANTD